MNRPLQQQRNRSAGQAMAIRARSGAAAPTDSAFPQAFMLLIGVCGYGVPGWMSWREVGRGVGVSLLWQAGFFLGLAALQGAGGGSG